MASIGPVGAAALDRLFILICKASPDEARDLASGLPAENRAQVALFCYGRTHLREVGRAIASSCDEASLVREGGQAGVALYAQRQASPGSFGSNGRGAPRISVAMVSLAAYRPGEDGSTIAAE